VIIALVATIAVINHGWPQAARLSRATQTLLKVDQDQKSPDRRDVHRSRPGGNGPGRPSKTTSTHHSQALVRASPAGAIISVIKEDSIILIAAPACLGAQPWACPDQLRFLQGQFGSSDRRIQRKFTLLDRYVLDLTHDDRGVTGPPARRCGRRDARHGASGAE